MNEKPKFLQRLLRLFPSKSRLNTIRRVPIGGKAMNKYATNKISTTKFNAATFLPKFLFDQFRQFFNLFFLLLILIQQFPGVSPTGRYTTLVPLAFVWCCSAIKEIIEHVKRRRADFAINRNKVNVLKDGKWVLKPWQDITVGEIVMISKDHFFPADLILLSSSETQSMAYIETSNLDGETNLKFRLGLAHTEHLKSKEELSRVNAELEYEPPNPLLYEFKGKIVFPDGRSIDLGPEQLLLRGAKLKNTERVYAVIIYTGLETKMMYNTRKPRSKRSSVDRVMNQQIICIIGIMLSLALLSTLLSQLHIPLLDYDPSEKENYWYLHLLDEDEENPLRYFVFNFFTFILLYNTLVPISLLVTLEFVRLSQALFLSWDLDMYHEPTKTAAAAKTSSLNEELGQVKYLLTDKTGTLTRNVMVFKKCSIGEDIFGYTDSHIFDDPRILSAMADHTKGAEIRDFLLAMAVCHTVIAEHTENEINYQASSPDEMALVRAAATQGYNFCNRTPDSLTVCVNGQDQTYKLLNVIEFSSSRKRMSIIVRCPDGVIRLFCKGSDSTIFPHLHPAAEHKDITDEHLRQFAESGYRTLCFAKVEIDNLTYTQWNDEYIAALRAPETIEEVAAKIEHNMTLLGASAIEDKLQEGVPETIGALLEADIKIWMLTGDKQETAINIGRSCNLIHAGMQMLIVNKLNYMDTRDCIESYGNDIGAKLEDVNDLALVIDGKSLEFALLGQTRVMLATLATSCRVVICCRVSPQQKAQVVLLIRKSAGNAVTLAIGDGGNDVPMIRAAHVGVGIYGQEGLQAACASDYSIAQFRFLSKLLFVHGAWNFHRIVKLIVYSYYKNAVVVCISFFYSIYSVWSGNSLMERWLIASYNMFFVSLAPLAIGLFERTATAETMVKYPKLYKLSQDRQAFSITSFFMWHFFAVLHSIVIYWFSKQLSTVNVWPSSGRTAGQYEFSTMLCGYIIVTVNLKAGLEIETWTWPVHVSVWGSILSFLLYVSVASYFWPSLPLSPEMAGLIELEASSPNFWFGLGLVPVSALFCDFILKVIRRTFFKTTADKVREIECQHSDLTVLLAQKLSDWRKGVELRLRRSPSVAKITEEVNRGYAFSQDEEGTISQSDLVRVDRRKEDSVTAIVKESNTTQNSTQEEQHSPETQTN